MPALPARAHIAESIARLQGGGPRGAGRAGPPGDDAAGGGGGGGPAVAKRSPPARRAVRLAINTRSVPSDVCGHVPIGSSGSDKLWERRFGARKGKQPSNWHLKERRGSGDRDTEHASYLLTCTAPAHSFLVGAHTLVVASWLCCDPFTRSYTEVYRSPHGERRVIFRCCWCEARGSARKGTAPPTHTHTHTHTPTHTHTTHTPHTHHLAHVQLSAACAWPSLCVSCPPAASLLLSAVLAHLSAKFCPAAPPVLSLCYLLVYCLSCTCVLMRR